MATYKDWVKEAEAEAKKYSDKIKTDNQYILDQLNKSKENALTQLQEQQNNAMYNLNTNKSNINTNANTNAKQLDVARLLALKSNQAAMNRAGLGTQGIVGSQVNSINNNYNTNLASVLNDEQSALRELEKTKMDATTQYNTNRLNLANEYDTKYADTQAAIDDKALQQYNSIYNTILALRQAEAALAEQQRQFNAQMALQREQYAAMLGNDGSTTGSTITTANYSGTIPAETRKASELYQNFKNTLGKDANGNLVDYQPQGVVYDGKAWGKVAKTGKTVAQYTGRSNVKTSKGVDISNQNVWVTPDGSAWVWNGGTLSYEPVSIYKSYVKQPSNPVTIKPTASTNNYTFPQSTVKNYLTK